MEALYDTKQLDSEKKMLLSRIGDYEKKEKEIDDKLAKYEVLNADKVKPEYVEEIIKREITSINNELARYKQADAEFISFIIKAKDSIDKESKYYDKSITNTFKKYGDSDSASKVLKTQLRELYNRYLDVLKKTYKSVVKEISGNKCISCKAVYEAYLLLCSIRDKMATLNIDLVKKNDFIVTIVPENMKQKIDEIYDSLLDSNYSFLFELEKIKKIEKKRKENINNEIRKRKSEIALYTDKINKLSKPVKIQNTYNRKKLDSLEEENRDFDKEKQALYKMLNDIALKQEELIAKNNEIINDKRMSIDNCLKAIAKCDEEKHNDYAINECMSQINDKQKELEKLESERNEYKSNLSKLSVFSFKEKKAMQDRIDSVESAIDSIMASIDFNNKKIEAVNFDYSNRIAKLKEEINSLQKEIDIQNDLIEKKISNNNYDDAIEDVNSRLNDINKFIKINNEDIEKFKIKIKNDERLVNIKNDSIIREVNSFKKDIDNCQKEINKLEIQNGNIHINALCVDYLSLCRKRVQPIVKKLKNDKKQIEKEIKELNKSIKDIDSKIKVLNKQGSSKNINKKDNVIDIKSNKKSNDIFGISTGEIKPNIKIDAKIVTNNDIEKQISNICILKGKRIISNIFFKVYVFQLRKINDSFDIWFEDENNNVISTKRTIEVSLNEDLPVGISLLSSIDFTGIKKCWCVIDFNDGELYRTEFDVSISFHLDF